MVIKREDDILTLRYRDAPKLPTFIRHVTTVALVNPGPLAERPTLTDELEKADAIHRLERR